MTNPHISLLSMRQVQAALNIRSRTTIYDMVAKKTLPPPCVINRRGLRWRESDIRDWIDNLQTRQ